MTSLWAREFTSFPEGGHADEMIEKLAAELSRRGKKVFINALGGSTPVRCLGYVACAFEIAEQSNSSISLSTRLSFQMEAAARMQVLLRGMVIKGYDPMTIRAHTVATAQVSAIGATAGKVNDGLNLLGTETMIGPEVLNISDEELGGGYGIPTSSMANAVRLMARSEGLLLDPVYSGKKAFAGLIADINAERIAAGSDILFIMTGGSPGLYACPSAFA
ncbi:pyridoxal-phosphate dependent enzyme [Rhizobium tubonense]|uniref:Tryptophan synthase beta chain-like PALP domain-containing protein n=1 Tax=Rhizobium tubonense TaxID=484088 RepID=A0A2W4DHA3_9HYPH|nr:pyridoxal-phosphate dependent enzyme [Rhizobium tubonense]PZM15804.1 hypothetical protein CPY51_05735 [Rhizobium tubonense]